MKRILLLFMLVISGAAGFTQELVQDQNPNFQVSRARYMKLADSVNLFQSTTEQQTYDATDYLADKQEKREERRQFRQDRRMERIRYGNTYYNNGWNNDFYYSPYNNYRPYRNNFYSPYNNHWNNRITRGTIGSPFFWFWMLR